jgi:hypothetical protein
MFFDAYVSLSQPFIRIRHSPGVNLGSRYCEHPVNEAQTLRAGPFSPI